MDGLGDFIAEPDDDALADGHFAKMRARDSLKENGTSKPLSSSRLRGYFRATNDCKLARASFDGTPVDAKACARTRSNFDLPAGPWRPKMIMRAIAAFLLAMMAIAARAYDGTQFLDACQVTNPYTQSFMQSDAALVHATIGTQPGNIICANGYCALPHQEFTTALNSFDVVVQLESTSRFFGQAQFLGGRTAVLVGPSLMATAPHDTSPNFNIAEYTVVFGLQSTMSGGVCQPPNFGHIPQSNIYTPSTTLPIVNTYSSGADYEWFYLTQNPNRPYLRMRRNGVPHYGDQAIIIGHPEYLSTKISNAVQLFGLDLYGNVTYNGEDVLEGSSGSMLYNTDHNYIEALVSNESTDCAVYQPDANNPPYYFLQLQCPSANDSNNLPIAHAANGTSPPIPTYSLLTDPSTDVTHVGAVGGILGPSNSQYTLESPSVMPSGGSIQWQILPPSTVPPGMSNVTFSPTTLTGYLGANATYGFTAQFGVGNQCGRFDEMFKVVDLTNGFTDNLTHHFEIGLTDFSVSPSTGFTYSKAIPPYNGTVAEYTLSNPRPSPVTITVGTSYQPTTPALKWLEMSYQQGSNTTPYTTGVFSITLSPSGSANSSVTLFARVNEAAGEALSLHVAHTVTLTLTDTDSSCFASTQSRAIAVSFTPGDQEYDYSAAPGGAVLPTAPSGTGYGAPISTSVYVADNYAVGHIGVDTGIYNNSLPALDYDFASMKVVLISPSGKLFTLWQSNPAPQGGYFSDRNLIFGGQSEVIGELHIDDSVNFSPVSGTDLTKLLGLTAQGTWTLQVSGTNSVTSTFQNWALRVAKQ